MVEAILKRYVVDGIFEEDEDFSDEVVSVSMGENAVSYNTGEELDKKMVADSRENSYDSGSKES